MVTHVKECTAILAVTALESVAVSNKGLALLGGDETVTQEKLALEKSAK